MAWFKKKKDPISERARELKKQISDLEGQIRKLSVQQSKAESGFGENCAASSAGATIPTFKPAPPASEPPKPKVGEAPSTRSSQSSPTPFTPAIPPAPPAPVKRNPVSTSNQPEAPAPPPKLRSTARPKSPTVFLAAPETSSDEELSTPEDPIFEEVGQNPFRGGAEGPRPEVRNHLDIRRNDLLSMWRRFKSHFRGPATSNPKLVNYLAAGSIQGLRPLRYERRVARNRFLVLVVVLILVLWGIVALIFFR